MQLMDYNIDGVLKWLKHFSTATSPLALSPSLAKVTSCYFEKCFLFKYWSHKSGYCVMIISGPCWEWLD